MQYQSFLIKYAEIGTKGKNRYIFEDALVKNIKYQLRNVDGSFEVRKESGRVYVETDGDYDYDETVATLSRIFGIVGICPVELHEDEGFDKLCEAVIEHINHVYKDKSFTFKVNARRARKNYPMTYKQRNATLKGENYSTPVSYWMPFNGGIGLHDAYWRSSFGGTIYKTNGSHGCINLPPAVAKTIYENISAGTAVLCYH